MSNSDNVKSNTPAEHFDMVGWADHTARKLAGEMARLMDTKNVVDRKVVTDGYKSGTIALDTLGNYILTPKETTKYIIIQKQGGYLDGLQLTIGDIKITYPNSSILMDVIQLPSFSIPITLAGIAGDTYVVVESSIENLTFSSALK